MHGSFPTTHYSLLNAAIDVGHETRLVALGCFIERYRPCLCKVFQQRMRLQESDAENLVQEFVMKKVLTGDLIQTYLQSSRRGFRHYLARSACNYAIDFLRIKRRDNKTLAEIEHDPTSEQDVVELFERALVKEWLEDLLAGSLRLTRDHCLSQSLSVHWRIFLRRFVEPIVLHCDPQPYTELAVMFGFQDSKKACNAVTTVLREFRRNWHNCLIADLGENSAEMIAEAMTDFRACFTAATGLDGRRLLLCAGVESIDRPEDGDGLDTQALRSSFRTLTAGFDALLDIEKEMLFKSYLESSVSEVLLIECMDEENRAQVGDVESELTFAELLEVDTVCLETLVQLKEALGRSVISEQSAVPRPVAAVLRLLVIALAWLRNRGRISQRGVDELKISIEKALEYSWLDRNSRTVLENFLGKSSF